MTQLAALPPTFSKSFAIFSPLPPCAGHCAGRYSDKRRNDSHSSLGSILKILLRTRRSPIVSNIVPTFPFFASRLLLNLIVDTQCVRTWFVFIPTFLASINSGLAAWERTKMSVRSAFLIQSVLCLFLFFCVYRHSINCLLFISRLFYIRVLVRFL